MDYMIDNISIMVFMFGILMYIFSFKVDEEDGMAKLLSIVRFVLSIALMVIGYIGMIINLFINY